MNLFQLKMVSNVDPFDDIVADHPHRGLELIFKVILVV